MNDNSRPVDADSGEKKWYKWPLNHPVYSVLAVIFLGLAVTSCHNALNPQPTPQSRVASSAEIIGQAIVNLTQPMINPVIDTTNSLITYVGNLAKQVADNKQNIDKLGRDVQGIKDQTLKLKEIIDAGEAEKKKHPNPALKGVPTSKNEGGPADADRNPRGAGAAAPPGEDINLTRAECRELKQQGVNDVQVTSYCRKLLTGGIVVASLAGAAPASAYEEFGDGAPVARVSARSVTKECRVERSGFLGLGRPVKHCHVTVRERRGGGGRQFIRTNPDPVCEGGEKPMVRVVNGHRLAKCP